MEGARRHPHAFEQSYPRMPSGMHSGSPLTPSSEEELYVPGGAWPFPGQYQAEFATPALYQEHLQDESHRPSPSLNVGMEGPYDPYATQMTLEAHMDAIYKRSLQGKSLKYKRSHSGGALIRRGMYNVPNRRFASP